MTSRPSTSNGRKLSTEKVLSTLELTGFSSAIRWRPMSVRKQIGLALAVWLVALSIGCVEDVRFDPSGCDVQVRGRWLVDGQNPTADTCGNIALVELAIIDDPERQFWVPSEFSLKCDPTGDSNAWVIDGGAYIDTMAVTRNRCDNGGEILKDSPDGGWKSRWRATDDLKFVVDCSPIEAHPITPIDGGTQLLLDVGTVDFQTRDGGVTCPQP
jgi:hypothetical protein